MATNKHIKTHMCLTCGTIHNLFKTEPVPSHGDACMAVIVIEVKAMRTLFRKMFKVMPETA